MLWCAIINGAYMGLLVRIGTTYMDAQTLVQNTHLTFIASFQLKEKRVHDVCIISTHVDIYVCREREN